MKEGDGDDAAKLAQAEYDRMAAAARAKLTPEELEDARAQAARQRDMGEMAWALLRSVWGRSPIVDDIMGVVVGVLMRAAVSSNQPRVFFEAAIMNLQTALKMMPPSIEVRAARGRS